MSMNTSTLPAAIVQEPQEQELMYDPQYLALMSDAAYETLRGYLEKLGSPDAVQLLDSLVVLVNLQGKEKVTGISNQMACETFALVSKEMTALGFSFEGKTIK